MSEIDRLRRMEQFQANEEILRDKVVTDNSKVNENLLAENQRLRTALEETVKKFDKGDNGTCAVCRIGHRLYDLKGNIGICEWADCLSHKWRAALGGE
jgi:hypothetical protein